MNLALLWHFHQPVYRRPRSRDYVLPWVNFHATKNYYQMARLAEETGFPCTYNFVPCLLEQIEDYAQGTALDPFQLALELPPDRLGPIEIERLRKFVPDETHATPLQRRAMESFFSPIDPLPADAAGMLHRQKEIHRGLIPLWKRLSDERRVELTVSPYYHPLLPMIFDAATAGAESPPGVAFRHPGDGHAQIRAGREYFRSVFGRDPKGIWPSEGGVSRDTAAAIAEAGFAFAVTDENILWKSLGCYDRRALYKPHRAEDLTVFFRDRELSDLIGFEYQRWDAKDAVADLLRRLDERRPDCDEDSLVVLALDGENPWGTFPQNGLPFLRELYARLGSHPGVTPMFFEDYLARYTSPSREIRLAPGTWLGSFSKWSGSPVKNRGWEILARARKACGPVEEILIAEGSDWFWWFGEEQTEEFAFLFELYISEAYRRAGLARA